MASEGRLGVWQCSANCIRRHILNVHTETTKKFECKHCYFTAKAKDYVNKHEKTLHEGKSYSCDDCSFTTDRYQKMRTHIDREHKGINYPCNKCEFISKTKAALNTHIEKQ